LLFGSEYQKNNDERFQAASSEHISWPVFATNNLGLKVWEASYLPFGGVHTSSGANIDLSFPGQWFQSESGLHQNWMRDDYRLTLLRQIGQHAHCEVVGPLPEATGSSAPAGEHEAILLAKVQDEANHKLFLYCAAEILGGSRDELIEERMLVK